MSTFNERKYQDDLDADIVNAWGGGVRNALAVLPTGGGKTHVFSRMMARFDGPTCAIAHRQELVTQISLALAKHGVKHRIVGPRDVVKLAVRLHMEEEGRSFYDPNAWDGVAGVDTLIRPSRISQQNKWLKSVGMWVQDEAHHVLAANKWGKAVDLFPDAVGLGVTATPERADGKGLGRHADGVFDTMIVGPSLRELIDLKYLTDYRIFAPPSDYQRPNADKVGKGGDFTTPQMAAAARESHVVGDIVAHYLRIAPGKRGVTFVDSVETAERVARAFNDAGVPAAALSAKTPTLERISTIRRFRNGELLQLVNVDLFGEGFDLPAIEVVSMARPTESFGLYVQQFGRALRLMDGKRVAIIIDHVGNVVRHGLPDAPREWSLDRREVRGKSGTADGIPVRACPECTGVYERYHKACPYCGHVVEPDSRSGPEFVDGDLIELDEATLKAMRGEIERIDGPAYYPANASTAMRYGIHKRHEARHEAQVALRASIAWWAGYQRSLGRDDSESYKRFYFAFGVDVMTAQTLGRPEALALADRVNLHIARGM